jgi:DNA mismatch repair protein MutS
MAHGIARVDVLSALANLAQERRYCRPSVVEERVLEIVDGRHPVLEQQLGSEFVANDCRLVRRIRCADHRAEHGGKSTYIRRWR